jgi:MSHA pilin protein MshA
MEQRGFTLTELIIVAMILGILAVTLAPRFINFEDENRVSALQNLKVALQGGAQLVYATSAMSGQDVNTGKGYSQVDINGVKVITSFGYPEAESMTFTNLGAWADISQEDWTITLSTDSHGPALNHTAFTPHGVSYNTDADKACYVLYSEAANAYTEPEVVVVATGC